jgi:hypothetical protein
MPDFALRASSSGAVSNRCGVRTVGKSANGSPIKRQSDCGACQI